MSTKTAHKPLNRRQKKALQAIIDADARTAEEIRDKMGVKSFIFDRWLQDENFCAELDRRLDIAGRIGSIILTRGLPRAFSCLNELLKTKNPETARKACADIHKLLVESEKTKIADRQPKSPPVAVTDPVECARLYKLYRPVTQKNENNQ